MTLAIGYFRRCLSDRTYRHNSAIANHEPTGTKMKILFGMCDFLARGFNLPEVGQVNLF